MTISRMDNGSRSARCWPAAIRWSQDNDLFVDGGPPGAPLTVKANYDNLLPSLDFKIEPIDNVVVRASFSQTLARADYGNLFASVTAGAPNRPTALGAAPAGASRCRPAAR